MSGRRLEFAFLFVCGSEKRLSLAKEYELMEKRGRGEERKRRKRERMKYRGAKSYLST